MSTNAHNPPHTTQGLSSWLTEPEAAERLRISERTLRRRCERGEGPERRERQRDGVRPEPVYNPDDVARLAAAPPVVMADESALAPRVPDIWPDPRKLPPVLEELAVVLRQRLQEPPPKSPARYHTLKAASARTGLSVAFLRRLIADGRLKALRDRALKVLEADLDNLDKVLDKADAVGQIVQKAAGRG